MKSLKVLSICFSIFFLISCNDGGGGSVTVGTGTLALSLTDNSTEEYRAV